MKATKRTIWFCLLVAVLQNLSLAGDKPWTLDATMSLKSIGDPQITADGTRVAYVVRSESADHKSYESAIWIASTDQSSKSDVLKPSHPSDHSPRWAPGSSDRLAFLSICKGKAQVYVTELSSGSPQAVTNSPTGVGSFGWSPDGKSIAYIAVDPPGPEEAARVAAGNDPIVRGHNLKYNRIYIVPAKGGQAALITHRDHHVLSFAWSPNGARIAYAAQKTAEDPWIFHVDVHEVNVKTGAITDLVTQEGRDASPSYSPDGKQIAFHTQGGTLNYFAERDVALVPLGGGPTRTLRKHL